MNEVYEVLKLYAIRDILKSIRLLVPQDESIYFEDNMSIYITCDRFNVFNNFDDTHADLICRIIYKCIKLEMFSLEDLVARLGGM